MKKHPLLSFQSVVVLTALLVIFACKKENDAAPGLYIEESEIVTYHGDNVAVNVVASDEKGIASIRVSIETWGISKVYDLSSQKPAVFNLNYQFVVPEDASADFQEHIVISVTNTSGLTTTKTAALIFSADVNAPQVTNYQEEVGIDFNPDLNTATPAIAFELTDDRSLASARFEIPGISFDQERVLTGRSVMAIFNPIFSVMGEYPATLTVRDASDNETVKEMMLIVMPAEPENPISNYARMYVVNLDKNPADYLAGYYRTLRRVDDYKYSALFYAPADNTKIAFVASLSLTSDWFGASPYVPTKLINSNGYAVPISVAAKGYYQIEIDILSKRFTITPHTPVTTPLANVSIAGTGMNHGNGNAWQLSPSMIQESDQPRRVKGNANVTAATGTSFTFCFTTTGWGTTWRPIGTAEETIDYWQIAASGQALNCVSQGPGLYPMLFDIETMWAEVFNPLEPENPISDYARMYVVNLDKNPTDYLIGYYRTLRRTGEYNYSALFYAPANNTKIAFVASLSLTSDWFGVSPKDPAKLINSNGYALPITVATKGYYQIAIDILGKSFTITPHTPTTTPLTTVSIAGTGMNHGNGNAWQLSPSMTQEADQPRRVRGTANVTAAAGAEFTFCFTTTGWGTTWRPIGTTESTIDYWYTPAASGQALGCISQGPGLYPTLFDIEALWAEIFKLP